MTLIQDIKAAQLQARKSKDKDTTTSLTVLISDAEFIGKNDGGRAPTDAEVIKTIKGHLKNIDETLAILTDVTAPVHIVFTKSKSLLESLLPKQLSDDELSTAIVLAIAETQAVTIKDMGKVMAVLKQRHAGLFDGTVASAKIKTNLGV